MVYFDKEQWHKFKSRFTSHIYVNLPELLRNAQIAWVLKLFDEIQYLVKR